MRQELKDILLKQLEIGLVKVKFVKKDETEREMTCTKNLALVPEESHPASNSVEDDDDEPEFVRVFDTVANGWRSIIFSSVKKIEAV